MTTGHGNPDPPPTELHTTAGDVALHEYRVSLGGHTWTILHTGAVLTIEDEQHLIDERGRLPYGFSLWPSSIALAHEIVARADELRGLHVLELGAGTGLAGIVAASVGARVVQTDRHQAALELCRLNGERNRVTTVEHRLADWCDWSDVTRYDWIIGADVIYATPMYPHLRQIFESNLAPRGRMLLSDPFRPPSFKLLEPMEADGWRITLSKWSVAGAGSESPIGVYELSRPARPGS